LCIHGFSQNHLSWTAGGFAQSLVELGLNVYLLDLRGHGDSTFESQTELAEGSIHYDWDINDYFEYDLEAGIQGIRERHHGEKVILCGHSMGGSLAVARTIAYGESAALVMLGAPLDLSKSAFRVKVVSHLFRQLVKMTKQVGLEWYQLPMSEFFQLFDHLFHSTRPSLASLLPFLVRYDKFQVISRLWNPHSTDKKTIRLLLQIMDSESVRVAFQLADWLRRRGLFLGRPEVDYLQKLDQISVPTVGAWGTEDRLAPFCTSQLLYEVLQGEEHQKLILQQTNHIDLTAGKPAQEIILAIKKMLSYL
jgi:pimeloyl-ACP methyl ester carboxylesterase